MGRVSMFSDSGNVAKKALTIAIRYGIVRRQVAIKGSGGKKEKEKEGKPLETILMYTANFDDFIS